MTRVSYVLVPPELEDKFYSALAPGDRFVFPRFRGTVRFVSRRRKKGLRARSLLPALGAMWELLTSEQKEAWTLAASEMNLNGWQLFVQDTTIRIINDIPGVAAPSVLHQSWAGRIGIVAPAKEAKIIQPHPSVYWIQKKVRGTKSTYEPIKVEEAFYIPLKIGLNYKANLTEAGDNPFAKFYAVIRRLYQGRTFEETLEVNLNLQQAWTFAENEVDFILGDYTSYSLFFHLNDVRGELLFDNIKSLHSWQNWARDPYCKQIEKTFSRAYFQVPQHWAAVVLPVGAEYRSIYPND